MKISRLAGLTALVVLALGQARADEGQASGLGFGIVRDVPDAQTAWQTPKPGSWGSDTALFKAHRAAEGFLKVTDARHVSGPLLQGEQ